MRSSGVVLRFRDYETDTIEQHRAIARRSGHVWWGWWKKADESHRLSELMVIREVLKGGAIAVGLFDRSTNRFYFATVQDCVFTLRGDPIRSPDADLTPAYYRDVRVPAWFQMSEITDTDQSKFIHAFGNIPVGDSTFFYLASENGRKQADSVQLHPMIRTDGSTVLHLSDVHFGADFGFPAKSGPGAKSLIEILLKDIAKVAPKGLALIVFSGDLTSRGDLNALLDPGITFSKAIGE